MFTACFLINFLLAGLITKTVVARNKEKKKEGENFILLYFYSTLSVSLLFVSNFLFAYCCFLTLRLFSIFCRSFLFSAFYFRNALPILRLSYATNFMFLSVIVLIIIPTVWFHLLSFLFSLLCVSFCYDCLTCCYIYWQ